jgi:perosamine synthetase
MVEARRRVGQAVREALAGSAGVQVGKLAPGAECSYWYLRVRLNLEALRVDKLQFCRALAAEGIPNLPDYPPIVSEAPWFANKAVFGESGFPWDCSDYKGPREPQARTQNALRARLENIPINLHESYGPREAEDIIAALRKVEAAYLR